jgi:ABC-type sugar transport system substrate-binding protein
MRFKGGQDMRIARILFAAVVVVVMLTTAGLAVGSGSTQRRHAAGGYNTTPAQDAQVLKDTLAWSASNAKAKKKFRIAWVKEDASLESYTQKETKGGRDVVAKYGGTVKVYDAKFNPNQQFRDLQDAITAYKAGQFDAIVVTPVAGSVVCNQVKKAIADHIPIELENLSVCGDKGYHPGAIGYVGMQQQRAEDEDYQVAFSSCKTPCNALVITGPTGFDLTLRDNLAIKKMRARYPNVHIIAVQAGSFTPTAWFQIARQELTAHPDINMISTNWDDSVVGVIRAVKQAHKTPGKDVTIFSVGGDSLGVSLVKSGQLAATDIVSPYHDGFYAMEQVFRFLITGKRSVGSVWPGDAPFIKDTVGSRVLTKSNVGKWKPEY